jgi:hypothetical protein
MRTIILFCMLLLIKAVAFGQTYKVEFAYDAAGNRISRKLVPLNKSAFISDTIAISEEQMGERSIKLYPNPTPGIITMTISQLEPEEQVRVFVTDMKGHILIKDVQTNPSFKIDLSAYPMGFYILSATIGDQRKEWKIIKE